MKQLITLGHKSNYQQRSFSVCLHSKKSYRTFCWKVFSAFGVGAGFLFDYSWAYHCAFYGLYSQNLRKKINERATAGKTLVRDEPFLTHFCKMRWLTMCRLCFVFFSIL